ncbi:MAG TPA: ABC transporter permease [Terriglobia bacterium]|nr:ABC transporter permease [Terriglobia bacterium]
MGILLQDLRFGLRMLAKNPGFTAVAVMTLALGIGANTTMFSVADAFLVKPLSLPHLSRLVMLRETGTGEGWEGSSTSPADFLEWKKHCASFESLAAYRWEDVNITGGEAPERVQSVQATANFFHTLGVGPVLGRSFANGEDEPGHDGVVVLSYGLWKSRFAADPRTIGREVMLNGRPYSIIGVMGKNFEFPLAVDLWTPLAMTPQQALIRDLRDLDVVARLRPGVSQRQALAEMNVIMQQLAKAYPKTNRGWKALIISAREFVNGDLTRDYTLMLLAAAGFVLLIACANVANLQFARATTRRKEIAVRSALGASRWRVARQLLTESILLGLAGAGLGLLIAAWSLGLILSGMPANVAKLVGGWNAIRLDSSALGFTAVIGVMSGILSGLLPALKTSNPDLNTSLKEGGRASTGDRSHHGLRGILVVAQMALAVILLVGAGLTVKGFRGLVRTQAQFSPEHVLTIGINLPADRYPDSTAKIQFYGRIIDKLRSLPGVQSAAASTTFPLSNSGGPWTRFRVEGQTPPKAKDLHGGEFLSVSSSYFRLMQIPLLRGRSFGAGDNVHSLPVTLINAKLARRIWPHQNPIGKHIRIVQRGSDGPWLTVVGVVGDVTYDWTDGGPEPAIYRPYTQAPLSESLLAVRTAGDAASLAAPARAAIAAIDPELPASNVMTLARAIYESIVGLDYLGFMMAALGLIALSLASVGVFGVMSYSVTERVHEIGIRMALGASRNDVLQMIVWRGMSMTLLGLAIGLPGAYSLARLLSSILFGVQATDRAVFFAVPVTLSLVALLACYIPARRASKVDPMVALRNE